MEEWREFSNDIYKSLNESLSQKPVRIVKIKDEKVIHLIVGKIWQAEYSSSTFLWVIGNFLDYPYIDLKNCLNICSPTFTIGNDLKWFLSLRLCPEYIHLSKGIELFLFNESNNRRVECSVSFALLDVKTSLMNVKKLKRSLFEPTKGRGFTEFIAIDELTNRKETFIPNGNLNIYCKIEVCKVDNYRFHELKPQIDQSNTKIKMFNDLNGLLHDDKFYDVTLKVEESQFHAHRAILAARSSYFASMFNHDTIEQQTGLIELKDVDATVMPELLRYIYTGRVKDLEQHAVTLLVLANKYLFDDLKALCEDHIGGRLSSDNAVEVLVVANSCNALLLKKRAKKLIIEEHDIIHSKRFENLIAPDKDLLYEFTRAMAYKCDDLPQLESHIDVTPTDPSCMTLSRNFEIV